MVEHALCHVVGVDDVAKHLYGVLVAQGDRGTREAYERSIGQRISDNLRRADVHLAGLDVHFLLKTVLPTVGLVGHHDDVMALRQRFAAFLKLLHRGEDDAIGLASFQQLFQVLPARRLHGLLA